MESARIPKRKDWVCLLTNTRAKQFIASNIHDFHAFRNEVRFLQKFLVP